MLGNRIKNKRKSLNLSAAQFAKIINISQGYLSEIENNKKVPTLDILQTISLNLGTTVSELIGEIPPSIDPKLQGLIEEAKHLSPNQIDALRIFLKSLDSSE